MTENELKTKYQVLYDIHQETVLALKKVNNDLSFYKQLVEEYELWRVDVLNNEHYKNISKLWDAKLNQVE